MASKSLALQDFHDQTSVEQLYQQALANPNSFWKSVASNMYFKQRSIHGLEYNFDYRQGDVFIRFMTGAYSNIAYNCLERNIEKGLGPKVAYYWEGNQPDDKQRITFEELFNKVSVFSSVLLNKGVQKGNVVIIYLPMVLELPIAMLACARIGAIHCVVFAGYSAESLATRILQTKSRTILTADGFFRGNKLINLKSLVDEAIFLCQKKEHFVQHCIVLEHLKRVTVPKDIEIPKISTNPTIDSNWEEELESVKQVESSVEWTEAEDPLFILHTSGSTGEPKGIVHTTIGYMLYAYLTMKTCFNIQDSDVFWCTADCGWITGHTANVYGALLNGLTTLIFEGCPTYPDDSRIWRIIEEYKVTKFYTAPTLIRSLMGCSSEAFEKFDRSSLKIIATAGEPINPVASEWLHDVIGEKKRLVIDTYWQTETGSIVIGAIPRVIKTLPGSATLPFFGISPIILDDEGEPITGGSKKGNLCFTKAWPGMARTIWNNHELFVNAYFKQFPGYFCTGDCAFRDANLYYWITGRVDDLIKVSGRLLSSVEIESALVQHPDVTEAAIVGVNHSIKGQMPYAFVTLTKGKHLAESIRQQLKQNVRDKIGSFAVPDIIQQAADLPKTRSGKIMRRVLRKIAEGNEHADLGDTSALVDKNVLNELWAIRNKIKTEE